MQLRSLDAWVLVALGLGWLSYAFDGGALRGLLVGSVGLVGAGMGVAALLLPGERRIPAYAALGFASGTAVALLGVPGFGLADAAGLAATALLGLLVAGRLSLAWNAPPEGVPEPEPTIATAAKVAIDEVLLGTFYARVRFASGSELRRIVDDVEVLRARHEERGFFEKPIAYHREPLPLETPSIETRSHFGFAYEHVRFDSEWEPAPDEPGRDRWLGATANRTAHAWVVRGDPSRPWLIAIHGYRMGIAPIDLGLFDPRWLHAKLGLNLIVPVLPLHGPRRRGLLSGDGYLDGDPVAFTYAEAQAIWDIRRLVGWARAQGASRVGVLGVSLGGYNAALLSSVEEGLDCVVAGIPVVDFSRILERHAPPTGREELASLGLEVPDVRELLRPVCPLSLPCKVAPEARAVFGGVADRVVAPDHQRDLIAHWDGPRHVWYQGGHLTFRLDASVNAMIADTLRTRLGAA